MSNGILKVYQEDWFPFQSLPAALAEFTALTGIRTELSWVSAGLGTIEHMFEAMIGSFSDDHPAYDVICCDESILQGSARKGGVLDLAPLMRAEGMTLEHVTPANASLVTQREAVLGLPCVNVSSMLLCRRDLLERYGLPVPSSWEQLHAVAGELQTAMRRDGQSDFYGFETRGAPGGGHSVWTIGSFLGSHGARWLEPDGHPGHYGEAHLAAFDVYLKLIRDVCPPDQGDISFVEMRRDYASGRVGMIMDVGMEYAHVLAQDNALAESSVVAMVPAGPAGRAPNLYAPPYAIPARTDMPDEAWELVKFLTTDKRLLADGLQSNAVECSSLPVVYGTEFDGHFRSDLLSTVRSTRAVAKAERPIGNSGIAGAVVVGDAVHAAVIGKETAHSALRRIHDGLSRLEDEAKAVP